MRNVKYLIEEIREATENQDFSEFSGIQDREILRYINDGQERIQSEIVKKSPKVFTKEVIIDVDGSEYYDLPYDILLGNKITDVKYQYTPSSYWNRLEPDYVANNTNDTDLYDASPCTYIRLAGRIALRPRPRRGQLRVTYVANIPSLDLGRGVVTASSVDADSNLLSLTLDTVNLDEDALARRSYLTIVNVHGDILLDQVKFDNIDAGTGVVTLASNPAVTVPLLNGVIVSGKKTSTHSSLDELIERYLIGYANMKVLQRDGSQEFQIQFQLVQIMEQEIVDSYAGISDDIALIPDIDEGFDEF